MSNNDSSSASQTSKPPQPPPATAPTAAEVNAAISSLADKGRDYGDWRRIAPAEVLRMKAPAERFLCPFAANEWGVDFVAFRIRDMDSQEVLFDVEKQPLKALPQFPSGFNFDVLRQIAYNFPKRFLRFKTVGTTLKFTVGDKPVSRFRMIERHYFEGRLLQSYDFEMPFCIPNTTNEWEVIYDLPELSEDDIQAMVDKPFATQSDSFYFVEDQLIMHNKASYAYVDDKKHAAAQPKAKTKAESKADD
eukprot:TRINITY_DN113315_c0_g1_i1.p2 TRINITY_DN113315_c0_g1~~TRINITY_DN113315_c0_g1_i1.p2  ORF type:complete len:265 (-),score=109.44 TRINITY_DN113315_c0_g1_i1:21-764(-)